MSSLTILLTRSRTGEAVVAALRDWAAAGQLGDFVWVRHGFGTLPDTTFTVAGGELTVAHLPTVIASRAPQRVRLMAVWSDLEGDLEGMTAATVAQAELLRAMNIGHLVPSTLNVTREGRFAAAGLLILTGFHNLLLSPDDGLGPNDPVLALAADDPIPVVGQSGAHAVATLGGLLPGLPESATDGFTLPLVLPLRPCASSRASLMPRGSRPSCVRTPCPSPMATPSCTRTVSARPTSTTSTSPPRAWPRRCGTATARSS